MRATMRGRGLVFWMLGSSLLFSWERPLQSQEVIEQYQPHDIVLTSTQTYDNPFRDVELTGHFQGPDGITLSIPGFHEGGNSWKVRFSASVPGEWTYHTECSDAQNDGLEQSGTLQAQPNANPRLHGAVQVDPDHPRHFRFEDGTPYFLIGYEADWFWALDVGDPNIPQMRAFAEQLDQYGFNHLTVNLYAHDTSWSPGHQNQWDYGPPGIYPWQGNNDFPDHDRLDPSFFQHYDRMMDALLERGMVAHLMIKVYNKFVNWPYVFSERDNMFWRYVIARYQAYPNVIWDTGKESYNIERYNFGYSIDRVALIRELDAYDRLVTVHDPNKPEVDDVVDFKSDQIHYNRYEDALDNYQNDMRPYVNIEYGYEEGIDDLPSYGVQQTWQEVLERSWVITMGGAYINYYYSNTAWDLIKPDPIPPGYSRYAIYRDFWNGVEYQELAPTPDVVFGHSQVFCRSENGEEYVFYATRNDLSFRLENLQGAMGGTWLNTHSGETARLEQALGNGDHTLVSPFGSDVVLHLRNHAPAILSAELTPNPYRQEGTLAVRVVVEDQDFDVAQVQTHITDSDGFYRGYVVLTEESEGLYTAGFDNLGPIQEGIYTLSFVALDSGGRHDISVLSFEVL